MGLSFSILTSLFLSSQSWLLEIYLMHIISQTKIRNKEFIMNQFGVVKLGLLSTTDTLEEMETNHNAN